MQSNVWLLLLRYTCIGWFHISLIVLVPLWHPEGGETGILTVLYSLFRLYLYTNETQTVA
ncbi:hypothetical protein EDB82DRAFT_487641 [Fusarium venenatum]|uniref:uncharacterized protein n=1 Tax=Fusarium venenatum TaxID=56646 RepID=UPI001DC9D3A5|nr:hypothetical protein EDB82DRAFT_487641 [Fusarium venenatum]